MSSELEPQRISIHGHEFGYRRAGKGPAILLIHGIAGSSRTWERVLPLLAADYDVIAPDLIGHGDTDKPPGDYSLGAQASALRDLLIMLDVKKATVVGQSFGGGVAMQLAYQFPEVCERLALVCSGGLGREVSLILRLLSLPGAEYVFPILFPAFLRDTGNKVVETLHRSGFLHTRASEMWRAYASLTQEENRQAFGRTLRAVIDLGGQSVSAMDLLYLTSRLPTLIVWGDQDNIIPISHAYAAHEAINGSRLEVIEGSGHFPQIEDPTRFSEVLSDFIRTSEPYDYDFDQMRTSMLDHQRKGA